MSSYFISHASGRLQPVPFLPFLSLLFVLAFSVPGQEATLSGTTPLTVEGDLSAQMVQGIDRFLMRKIDQSIEERATLWRRDFSSREAYDKSVQPNRERFRKQIGATDPRLPVTALEYVSTTRTPALVAETELFAVYAVRWPVFESVFGEGLLLRPKPAQASGKASTPPRSIVAIPDANQTPEMLAGLAPGLPSAAQWARRLAENGCQVLIPALIDRQDTWSGNSKLNRFTNQPHREWIYRQAFEMGRHIIGYEAQKVMAAIDWFDAERQQAPGAHSSAPRIGVMGYGEGGLIALYSAALDSRVEAALVSGYFGSRQRLWEEPIYRNVFGLLHEFGDAEIASLIAPRTLIVEHSDGPKIDGPPRARSGRSGAAAGKWATPEFDAVEKEVARANALVRPLTNQVEFIYGNEGMAVGPGFEQALTRLLNRLGTPIKSLAPPGNAPKDSRTNFDPSERQQRQVEQLVEHTQKLLRLSERVRDESFLRKVKTAPLSEYQAACQQYKSNLWEEVIGRFPSATQAANPRSRKIYDREKWTGYDVMLDVWPDVFAWGVLLLPKDMKPGERRPVVVCQHGLEGVPADTITDDPKTGAYGAYKAFAAHLAERGFVVFAPHNPYRGEEKFRVLQRKANSLGKSLFSVILAQHDRILDWLSEQPFVDPTRIGFYGLSYGGKTAMRVPALLDRYCLSICSADFNEWIKKCSTVDSPYSYLYTIEYDMYEFNLGHTFNYAEMAALIAPRPFMVERGHNDGVAPDEWVAYEYAKIRRLYAKLGIPERTDIEFFNGPHTINGKGTFKFLHQHLNWPEPNQ